MDELRSGDPQWIGSYRLLGRLGTGGMGHVFLARSGRGRTVAVKLVRAELAAQEEFRTRFRREVLSARRVGGTWTAPVLDADTEAEVPWVATGYVAGPSLQHVVKEYGPLPERSVRVLASGLAHALADIHAAGLVHRDLKPSNVMITIDGPRVIDFGIARALETVADGGVLTYTGAMVGSPAFMSPEQVRGDRVTPACDIFCLGSVLAYAATGLQPFGAASSGVHAQMFRIAQEPPDLDGVPAGLRELVSACLVKELERRPSLAEVLELVGAEPADTAEPWLPGGIVAQLGRRAVELLELEAEATQPGIPPGIDEPRSAEPPSAERPEPDDAPEAGAVPEAVDPPAPYAPTAYVPAPYAPTAVSAPTPVPAPTPQPASAYVHPAYTSRTEVEPQPPQEPPPARGRRGALIAVLALLAVIAGGTTAFVVVQQENGHHDQGTPGTPTPSSGSPSSSSTPTEALADDAVPQDVVGTWRTTFDSPDQGSNTRTLTIRQDGSVELEGAGADYTCTWSMHVTSAGPPTALSPSEVIGGEPASSCTPGAATTVALVDPTHLRRDNADPGKAPLTYEKVG